MVKIVNYSLNNNECFLESKGRASHHFFLSTSASVQVVSEVIIPVTVVEAFTVPKESAFTKMNPLTIRVLIKNLAKNISLCTISLHSNIGLFL